MPRAFATLLLLLALGLPVTAGEHPLASNATLTIGEAAEIHLVLTLTAEAQAEALLKRHCGALTTEQAATALEDREPGAPLRIPWRLLGAASRRKVLLTLFPEDRRDNGHLVHRVRFEEETFSLLSRLWTGSDRLILDLFSELGKEPEVDDLVRVDRRQLSPELASLLWQQPGGLPPLGPAPAEAPEATTEPEHSGTPVEPAPAEEHQAVAMPDIAAIIASISEPDDDLEGVAEDEPGPATPIATPPKKTAKPRLPPLPKPRAGLTYRRDADGNVHGEYRVARGDSLYRIAARYSGRKQPERVNAAIRVIQRASGLKRAGHIVPGKRIVIPGDLLGGEYAVPEPPPEDSTCGGALPAARGPLTYQRTADGRVEAVYRLKHGEALYSSVVIRFSGRLRAGDVNALAMVIAKYNGIKDVTDIATGAKIRIPAEYLDDPWHPCPEAIGDGTEAPAAVVVEEEVPEAVAAPTAKAGAAAGLHFILDAGHGGVDPGAVVAGMAEDEYAYDLIVRIKRHLEAAGGTVHTLLYDKKHGYTPRDQATLGKDRNEALQTKPAWFPNHPKRAVMVRIALANRIHRELTIKQNVPADKILFLSLHLDHLHHSVRGSFAYYPHSRMRRAARTIGGGPVRKLFKPEERRFDFSSAFRKQSQAASRHLAYRIVRALKAAGFPITRQPVRYKIYRGRRVFSPAVVRYAPTRRALLLEAFNLGNKKQRERVKKHEQRELYAATVANALIADLRGEGTIALPPGARDDTKPSWKKKKRRKRSSKKKKPRRR